MLFKLALKAVTYMDEHHLFSIALLVALIVFNILMADAMADYNDLNLR